MTHRVPCLLPVAALLLPGFAAAEWRCDCTTIMDSCAAEVSLADEFVEVTTDTNQCARVDYFIDGRPFVAVVTDGRQRQDWISRSADPNVLIQSCQVCRDNAGAAAASPAPAPAPAAGDTGTGTLEPLIEIVPTYPAAAASAGRSGYVEVQFTVLPSGEVEDVSVTTAEPANVFDAAAIAAVRRWRYPADPDRAPQQVGERIEFSPSAAAAAARPAQSEAAEPASRGGPSGPVSECVREDAVYNYGEVIEVGLINACSAPLAVYACAQGVGPRQGRWHCTGADTQRELLVPQDDAPLGGSVISDVAGGQASFAYVDAVFITRAPNTQYWWLACRADDASCRTDARGWTRAVDGQLARIDPQLRSPARVSRSY